MFVAQPKSADAEYAGRVPADGLHPASYLVTPEIVRSANDAGLFVNAWTVDKADEMKRMAASGVDAVITNCPGEMISILNVNRGEVQTRAPGTHAA